jgi:hypothetical protein
MIFRTSSKMGHLRSKTRSQELKNRKKLVNILVQISWKSVRKVVLMSYMSSVNMGKFRQKLGHSAQIWKNLFNTLEVTFFTQLSTNLARMLV